MNHSAQFSLALLATASMVLPLAACSQPAEPSQPTRPNIILIMTDDQPPHTLEDMPILNQELIEKGILFNQGYVTTPLCCPSRASILTGQYAHNHDVLSNRPPTGSATAFDDISTVATWLDDAGYRTSYIGKYLNSYDLLEPAGYIPPGWDDWHVFYHKDEINQYYYDYSLAENGEMISYGSTPEDYGTDVLNARALDFIQSSQNEPFFLVLSYYSPHQTYRFADRHAELFRTDEQFTWHRPPNFAERDKSDKPDWLQALKDVNRNYVDNIHQRMLRSLMAVDEGIGQIVELLDKYHLRENTVIIFMSDNGLAMGEHGMTVGKNCPYEACIQVPFVVSYPALTGARQDDHFVLNIDLAPTIADLAGVAIPDSVDGLSMLPLMQNAAAEWRPSFLIEHFEGEEGLAEHIPPYQGVRTEQWKYIRYDTGEEELYDMVNDPYEMDNLAGNASYSQVVTEMSELIERYSRKQ